ncbi:hypothetical protein ABZ498_15835 [Streptomyces lavendulocolor]|uniref:hypothetical protein n=1 Tax=Streptomyces lavendulocolor TaxID=67316 RepID=UPI0033EF284E
MDLEGGMRNALLRYEEVFGALRGEQFYDVRIAGFTDRDERVPRFTPLGRQVYLTMDSGDLLLLESLGNHGQLGIRRVADYEFPHELDGEDEEFTVGSCGPQYLGDLTDQSVLAVRYVLNAESDPVTGTVRCAEFAFAYGQRLFVDPGYHWGIRLQGAGAYEAWLAEERENPAPLGPLTDHLWTP